MESFKSGAFERDHKKRGEHDVLEDGDSQELILQGRPGHSSHNHHHQDAGIKKDVSFNVDISESTHR